MQLSVNCDLPEPLAMSLMDLRRGDAAILDGIDLPTDDARRLMELGFVPGMSITAGRSAPGGDPRVFTKKLPTSPASPSSNTPASPHYPTDAPSN